MNNLKQKMKKERNYINPDLIPRLVRMKRLEKCALTRKRTNQDNIYVVKGTMSQNIRTKRD